MSRLGRIIGISFLVASSTQAAPRFIDLGTLHGGGGDSWANGVSPDGLVVVGASVSPAPGPFEAFRWTEAGGMEPLGVAGTAFAASANGSVIVGTLGDYNYIGGAFRWENGIATFLPPLPAEDLADAYDISANGRAIVGESHLLDGNYLLSSTAVRWIDGVPESLAGSIPAGSYSQAVAVSADGTVIVGNSNPGRHPWCLRSGSYIGLLGPEIAYKWVSLLSANGSVAVGNALYWGGPLRWNTLTGELTTLGVLPGFLDCRERAISFDGSVIVGSCYTERYWWQGDAEGFVWDAEHGFRNVENVLIEAGLTQQISGWDLYELNGVSDDGKVFVGKGTTPGGLRHAWLADLRSRPVNDDCENAQPIGWGPAGPFTEPRIKHGTTVDALVDGASMCSFPHGPDVWYSFEAPADGHLFLDTCGTVSWPDPVDNLVLSVHYGCPGSSANTLACASDCTGPPCTGDLACIYPQNIPVNAGQTYKIRVAQNAGDEPGDFELTTRFLPDNDECDDAFFVDVPSQTPGLTSPATVDTTPPCDDVHQTAPGVWYKVVGTGREIIANTFTRTDYDTKLTVFCGGCGGLECITANDDYHYPEVLESSVSWCSQHGVVYHVLVHGYSSDTGNFVLDVFDGGSCTTPQNCDPPNDTCADALVLPPGMSVEIIGDNTNTTTAGSATCEASNHDVWYSYTAACNGQVQIDTCQPEIGSLQETVLSVYDACDGTEFACDFDPTAPCLGRAIVTTPTTPGTELIIRVADAGTLEQNQGTFPLRVQEAPWPMVLVSPGGALPDASQGEYYTAILPMSGGCPPYLVEALYLPAGLQMRYNVIYGTPEVSGAFIPYFQVWDDAGSPMADGWMSLEVLPSNDVCGAAISITEGGYPFGNIDATTDGPDEPFDCNFSDYSHIESDIWFCYTSSCEGDATVDLCDSTYDTKVAVYEDCRCGAGLGPLLTCDDDSGDGWESRASFDVHDGDEYLIRVGGFMGYQGNALLTVTCRNKPVCCFPDYSCANLPEDECASQGGISRDSFAPCTTYECSPTEACCFYDGGCADLSLASCSERFGFPQGEGTTCTTASCPMPEACCFPNGQCQELPPNVCVDESGSPQGAEVTCATVTCPELEACCLADGTCQDLTLDDCSVLGGVSLGPGTICAESFCPVLEACCLDDGSCQELDTAECAAEAGESQGAGTRCATTSCPQPPVGCCLPDDSCEDLPPVECTAQNGRPQYGRLCTAVDCIVLTGACCFQDGSCQDLMQQDCLGGDGIDFTPDTSCMAVTCAQPEACCMFDGTCNDLTSSYCRRYGGESGGPGSACNDDCNGDSASDSCQIFGDVDFNGSVDLTDWQQMVECLSGPDVGVSGQPCRVCILDCDDDVDLLDIVIFQRVFSRQ